MYRSPLYQLIRIPQASVLLNRHRHALIVVQLQQPGGRQHATVDEPLDHPRRRLDHAGTWRKRVSALKSVGGLRLDLRPAIPRYSNVYGDFSQIMVKLN